MIFLLSFDCNFKASVLWGIFARAFDGQYVFSGKDASFVCIHGQTIISNVLGSLSLFI